jgi:hypothetical protein
LLKHLVDEQHTPTMTVEIASEIGNTLTLKIEVVHVDIQALLVEYIEVLFGILQEESGLSDTARTFDTDHTVVPINLIHQNATNWCVRMLDKVSVCPEKSFHSCLICFRLLYKVVQRYTISCKLQSLNSKIFVKSVIFLISK